MKFLQLLIFLSFFVIANSAYAENEFEYDDKTTHLKEFIENYSSGNENNRPVYLEKLTTSGVWSKMALVFGYADNMAGCQKEMVELIKEKYWRANYRCTNAN